MSFINKSVSEGLSVSFRLNQFTSPIFLVFEIYELRAVSRIFGKLAIAMT